MKTMIDVTRALLLIAMTLSAGAAGAQAARSGGGDARMQQALQQLTAEKAQLQAENAKLKIDAAEAKDLRKENEKLTRELEFSKRKLGNTESNNTVLAETLESARTRLDEIVERYRELATQFRDTELELMQVSTTLAARDQALLSCADSNDQLAAIALDALDRYENKGFFKRASEVEPFTGIGRARVSNLVDEYSFQVEELRLADDVTAGIGDVLPDEAPSNN